MKIALCYSGSLRTFSDCVGNHSLFFKNPDVFISTWSNNSRSQKINDPWHKKGKGTYPNEVTKSYIENLLPKTFKLNNLNIENFREDIVLPINCQNKTSLSCQYYKIKDCYDLIPEPYSYDFIIRIRGDMLISDVKFSDKKLIFPDNIWYNYPASHSQRRVNEMLWISNPELMRKSTSIYKNLLLINNQLGNNDMHGERICFQNLLNENLLDFIEYFSFKYNILR